MIIFCPLLYFHDALLLILLQISTKPWLDELYETLTKVSDIMTNCAQVSQKTYTKMLRTTHVSNDINVVL